MLLEVAKLHKKGQTEELNFVNEDWKTVRIAKIIKLIHK